MLTSTNVSPSNHSFHYISFVRHFLFVHFLTCVQPTIPTTGSWFNSTTWFLIQFNFLVPVSIQLPGSWFLTSCFTYIVSTTFLFRVTYVSSSNHSSYHFICSWCSTCVAFSLQHNSKQDWSRCLIPDSVFLQLRRAHLITQHHCFIADSFFSFHWNQLNCLPLVTLSILTSTNISSSTFLSF